MGTMEAVTAHGQTIEAALVTGSPVALHLHAERGCGRRAVVLLLAAAGSGADNFAGRGLSAGLHC